MGIPDDKVQEVRDRVDIVDLVGRYVELRRAGRNFKGLCPFHSERTPSFNVNPQRKGYKCFGCGAGGDALRFVMEVEGKSFPEAVRKLAELFGVSLPASSGSGFDAQRETTKDAAYGLMRLATELYEKTLHDGEHGAAGRDYLERRQIPQEVAKAFRLGYAPAPGEAGWDLLVRAIRAQAGDDQGGRLSLAQSLGLVARSERTGNRYDRFRGRLMFPIIAPGSEVVAFSGRIVPPHDAPTGDDDRPPPKYVNSAESILYTKGKTLYGLANARQAMRAQKRAILVEGNVDVLKLHEWGHAEAVCPLGTALTPEQSKLIARFTKQVVLCFDGDTAGKKAAWAALPLLLEVDVDVRMVLLPEGEDPDSLGADRVGALLARPRSALEQMMMSIAERAGDAAQARARGLDRVIPLIARAPRQSARDLFADRAADLFKVDRSRVEHAIRAVRSGAPRSSARRRDSEENSRPDPSISTGPVPLSAPVRSLPPLPAGQVQLAMLLVDVPHLASIAERSGAVECVTDPRLAPIVGAVVQGAREGEDPTMPDLLELVDGAAQRQVHDAVFEGRYRDGFEAGDDPQIVLRELVQRCRESALNDEIKALEREVKAAENEGYPERATQLQQRRLELRRRQAALRQTSADAPPDDSAQPTP